MEWLNKLVDTIHQHGTDYAQVDRSRTTWQLVSSSPGCIRKSYHNWPSIVSSLPEFAYRPCVAYTDLTLRYTNTLNREYMLPEEVSVLGLVCQPT